MLKPFVLFLSLQMILSDILRFIVVYLVFLFGFAAGIPSQNALTLKYNSEGNIIKIFT